MQAGYKRVSVVREGLQGLFEAGVPMAPKGQGMLLPPAEASDDEERSVMATAQTQVAETPLTEGATS
jgi:hypothetical protein